MPPVKNPVCKMTSYGGITRIRLKGRSSITSSQPALQAPLYLFVDLIIYRKGKDCKCHFRQNAILTDHENTLPGGEGVDFRDC